MQCRLLDKENDLNPQKIYNGTIEDRAVGIVAKHVLILS